MAVATGLFSRIRDQHSHVPPLVGAIHESPVIRDQRSGYIVGDGALDVPKTMKFAYAYGESPAIRDQRSHTAPRPTLFVHTKCSLNPNFTVIIQKGGKRYEKHGLLSKYA